MRVYSGHFEIFLFTFISFSLLELQCSSQELVESQKNDDCMSHGDYQENGICQCEDGWTGNSCQHCQGRFLLNELSGEIEIAFSYGYHFNNCTWIVQADEINANSSLHILFNDVKSSCECNFLSVYDGDSVYSPVLASYSGVVFPAKSEVIAWSGKAFFHFKTEGATSDEKFNISYWYENEKSPDGSNDKTDLISRDEWRKFQQSSLIGHGRASSAMSSLNQYIYLYSGFVFGIDDKQIQMLRIDTSDADYKAAPVADNHPQSRFGHTMITWKDQLIVFGGTLFNEYIATNQLLSFNSSSNEWTEIFPSVTESSSNDSLNAPTLTGHTSHLVQNSAGRDVMLVFFGYHPLWHVSNFVFEYDLVNNTWKLVKCEGALPHGGYGHASAHDELNNVVYVHGGLKIEQEFSKEMYKFDVEKRFWFILNPSLKGRYLHSMVLLNNALYIFGGQQKGVSDDLVCGQCEQLEFLKYDIESDVWEQTKHESWYFRSGHSALSLQNETMFVYGGYDGTMWSDILTYEIDPEMSCANLSQADCVAQSKCSWKNNTCSNNISVHHTEICDDFCSAFTTCANCLSVAIHGCNCSFSMQSSQKCFYGKDNTSISDIKSCPDTPEHYCATFKTCDQCNFALNCSWNEIQCLNGSGTSIECPPSCSNFTDCSQCTSNSECDWCDSTNTCLPRLTSAIYYPYDTCLHFVTYNGLCSDPCAQYTSCDDCTQGAKCGWCDLGSDTGIGSCLSGSSHAPLNNESCSSDQWNFFTCPACQCNGHSTCDNEGNCTDCEAPTIGEKCDACDVGFYGHPVNGTDCSECVCYGHSEECDVSGRCFCDTLGIVGDNCDSCDSNFDGEPTNGSCYDYIRVGFKYRESVTGSIYENITFFNFETCPLYKSDLLLKVSSLNNEVFKSIFITYLKEDNGTIVKPEEPVASYSNQVSITAFLRQIDFKFGMSPQTCLRIYHEFDFPIVFEISIAQTYTNVGLLLGVFFSVFLILLVVAVVMWKINNFWRRFRRRRRRDIELQEMAARPFATIDFEYKEEYDHMKPTIICNEELSGGKAASVTVLLWLPWNKKEQDSNSAGENQPMLTLGTTLAFCNSKTRIYNPTRIVPTAPEPEIQGIDNLIFELDNNSVRSIDT